MDLAHVGARARRLEALELPGRRIEAQHHLRGPLGGPHLVGLVDVHRVDVRVVAGRLPFRPLPRLRLIAAQVAGVPFSDPDIALRVGPYAARALALRGWLDDFHRIAFDAADVRPGKRSE